MEPKLEKLNGYKEYKTWGKEKKREESECPGCAHFYACGVRKDGQAGCWVPRGSIVVWEDEE